MLTTKSLTFFKPDPNQPRKFFDEVALRALGELLKIRQNEPVQAKPDGVLIDGERRWRAGKLVGLEKLEAIITETALTETQISVIRLSSFFHREGLTWWEKWNACQRLLELNPTWQGKDLAAHLALDASSVTRLLSPSRCITAWQDALKDGKVGLSDIYAASKLPESEQASLLEFKLSGATRDQLEERIKKSQTAAPATDSPKLHRAKCQIGATGVVVTVSGPAMNMEQYLNALTQAREMAMKASKESLDLKTAMRVWADKAKASS